MSRPLNASQRVAGWLAAQGLEQVFAVTGGGAMFLNHALATEPGLHMQFMHHEQACAMAAEGYARLANKPALVNVTTGPGGLNALNGVWGAFTDSVPMIVVSGQVKRATALSHTPVAGLRQLGDQELPIVDVVRPLVKGAWAIASLAELGEVLPQAWALATQGRPGPVWLDIPIDLQSSPEPFEFIPVPTAQPKAADAEQVQTALQWLQEAHRPVLLGGSGVHWAGARSEFLELAEQLGLPVCTAWTHDLIDSSHPLFAGRPGTIGTRAGNLCLQQADLVLVVGSRLNIRQVSYNWASFAAHARIVMVDVDPAELSKPLVKPHLPIQADARCFLQQFLQAARRSELPNFGPWQRWCTEIQDRFPALEPSNVSDSDHINPYAAVQALFEALPERGVVACGNASACILPFQVGRLRTGQRLFSNSGSASMGYDLPAALGAAIADPTRRVVCLAGDGSLQMNVQELQTLRDSQANVCVVVLANDGYLSIRLSHQNHFGTVLGADAASGLHCPDYVALARAYGLPAFDIHHPNELQRLREALYTIGPLLVQLHVDPLQAFSPKLQSRLDEQGRFQTPELDDVFPFLPARELNELRRSGQAIRSEKRPHDR
ncbi:thiamine pyrophosphate-binding protein [Inhella sp.]|uniref:thiamine pyrophosphate-binding protein n=1 Tax=Inhella sp. TaxID=1921806 RepID=UPI0035B37036